MHIYIALFFGVAKSDEILSSDFFDILKHFLQYSKKVGDRSSLDMNVNRVIFL